MDHLKVLLLVSGGTLFVGSGGLLFYNYILLTGQFLRLVSL